MRSALCDTVVMGTTTRATGSTTTTSTPSAGAPSAFAKALLAEAPLSEAPAAAAQDKALQMFGQLVGSWAVEIVDHQPDGTQWPGRGEWHFSWILQGRAIQDVWISPPRAERPAALEHAFKNRFGTTIRVYDATSRVWHVTWNNPPNGDHVDLTAPVTDESLASGSQIVQEGRLPDGTRKRWSFRDITRDSFRWLGEASRDEGRSWQIEQEMWARRV
jgi:hypothetical protein